MTAVAAAEATARAERGTRVSEKPPEEQPPQHDPAEAEEGYELDPEEVYAVEDAVEAQDRDAIRQRLLELYPADQADLLETLSHNDRAAAGRGAGRHQSGDAGAT